ncbi:hypothetical protein MTO96_036723 [Rhipicephalus appendiculatus]
MAAPAYFPEAFMFLAAIARQHRGRKELDDAYGLPASERVRRHLDCIARRKKDCASAHRCVVAEVIVRGGVRKWFHFPWTPDEKGAFKKVSSAAGVIGCVDGSVAVIIAPKGDPQKAASYCCKKHYADIVMLSTAELRCACLAVGSKPPDTSPIAATIACRQRDELHCLPRQQRKGACHGPQRRQQRHEKGIDEENSGICS